MPSFFFLFFLLSLTLSAGDFPRYSGVREMTPEEREYLEPRLLRITERRLMTKAPLPASVKNTAHLPAVSSQGSLGSCAAYATAYYYKTYQLARRNNWINPNASDNPERIASPAWAYNMAQRSTSNEAVSHWMVAQNIVDFGIASWAEMPYNPDRYYYDWDAWPSEEVWRRKIEWRGKQVGAITTNTRQGIDALKEHLAGGDLAIVAVEWRTNLREYPNPQYGGTSSNVVYRNAGSWSDGHALTLVGYDDNKTYYIDDDPEQERKGAFLLVNSWGTDWGVEEPSVGTGGFIWIAYDYFLYHNNYSTEALIMIDREKDYKPELFAVIGIDHTRGRQLFLNISGGEKDNPSWERSAMPVSNPYPLTDEDRIIIDLTDYIHLQPLSYHLRVFQLPPLGQFFGGEGEITYFAVERAENSPVESTETPKAVVNNWFRYLSVHNIPESMADFGGHKTAVGGTAWADYNGNGIMDLLITGRTWRPENPSTLLFANNGDGTFQPGITAGLPQMVSSIVAAGDYNNSGYPDIVIYGYDPEAGASGAWVSGVYRNNGDLSFTGISLTLPDNIVSFAWVDYDSDGKLDLAVSTLNEIFFYRNTGGDSFVQSDYPVYASGSLAFGDFDNDGLLDMVVTGTAGSGVFRNMGDGIFVNTGAMLPPVHGTAVIADFDNDGLLDFAISGRAMGGSYGFGGLTAIYRNEGNWNFKDIKAPLRGLWGGNLAWGDINNNGYPDLAATGRDYDNHEDYDLPSHPYPELIYSHYTTVYANNGEGNFRDAKPALPRVSISKDFYSGTVHNNTLALLDYDGSGNLDIFLSGTIKKVYSEADASLYTGLRKNRAPDFYGKGNEPPEQPTGLRVESPGEEGSVMLRWDAPTDDNTPSEGLYYNVKVGTSPGLSNIVSCANFHLTPGRIMRTDTGFLIRNLAPGTYYWSVQAADASFALSQWSAENSFTVSAYTPVYNLRISSAKPETGTTLPAPGINTYNENTPVEVTALPYGGYVFSHWEGDIEEHQREQNPVTLVMDRFRTVTAHFKLIYNSSPDWQMAVYNPPWGGYRINHSTVVFDGKLWLIGGTAFGTNYNDVWYSEDGAVWTQAVANAGWTRRYGHASLVFDDKIWVMGGIDNSGPLNDIWYSENGSTWIQVPANDPWEGRYTFAALVYDEKMWVMGGRGAGKRFNDVFYSEDGETWTKATDDAAWYKREGPAAVVFHDKMWIIGGIGGEERFGAQNYASLFSSDAWYSEDGVIWTAATRSAPWVPRYLHTSVAHDNRIWIFGGIVRGATGAWNEVSNEAWYSFDGVNWSQTPETPGWNARRGHTSAVFDDKLWVMGGHWDVWSGAPPAIPGGMLMLTVAVNTETGPGEVLTGHGGTVEPAPGYHYDTAGAVFELRATPAFGYIFTGWTGGVDDPASPETFTTLNVSKTVTANFQTLETNALTISATPAGRGSISPTAGTHNYPVGATVQISAIPGRRFAFSHWTGAVEDPLSASTTVVMDDDKTVAAHFINDPFAPSLKISAGSAHSVFLKNEGTVWTFGDNTYRQLGDGTTTPAYEPVISPVLQGAVAVSAGENHTAALRGNRILWTWGRNNRSQLGLRTGGTPLVPTQVPEFNNVFAVSCGGEHTLVLTTDGTVWYFGDNLLFPFQVKGVDGHGYLGSVTEISAGYLHNLALHYDGTVSSWRDNSHGQLGDGTQTATNTPVKVKGLEDVKGISAGGMLTASHSLAVKSDGSVWAWGDNSHGQLGDGSTDASAVPVRVAGEDGAGYLQDIRKIAAGGRHSLALDKNGVVWAWGDNTFGQMGTGDNEDSLYPLKIETLPVIVEIAAGTRHSLALDTDGNLWTWGHNVSGQMGDGTTISSNIPVSVAGMNSNTLSFILTTATSPASGGEVSPLSGKRYRPGTTATITAEAAFRYEFTQWEGDAEGSAMPLHLLMDGNRNVTARFNVIEGLDFKLTMAASPEDGGYIVPAPGEHEFIPGTVVSIFAFPGYRHIFSHWEGDNIADPSAEETTVALLDDTQATAVFTKTDFSAIPAISAGWAFAVMLHEDGTLWVRGGNWVGQLGLGYHTPGNYNPGAGHVVSPDGTGRLSGIVAIAAGGAHTAALSYDGTVYTWGDNSSGQLGDGTTTMRTSPVKVKSPDGSGELKGVIAVYAGGSHTAALRYDGTLWTWGGNGSGQLGNNTTDRSLFPVQVRGEMDAGFLEGVVSVACGEEHTLALLDDGTLRAWGLNGFGAFPCGNLGDGTSLNRSTPVRVLNLEGVKAIAAGAYQSYAVRNDGTLWSWGRNFHGALGVGETEDELSHSSVPLQIASLTGIVALAAGDRSHALALTESGNVYGWGLNWFGQVGDNTGGVPPNDQKISPVQVVGADGAGWLADVIAISAGYEYSMALKSDGTVWFWGRVPYGSTNNRRDYPSHHGTVPDNAGGMDAELVYLRMEVFPPGTGAVMPIESVHAYNPGSVANLRAEPSMGYRFSHWSSNVDNIHDFYTTTLVDNDKTVTAYFEKLDFIAGDINKDGIVDMKDVTLSLRMSVDLPLTIHGLSKSSPYPSSRRQAADVYSDGIINVADSIIILRKSLGLGTDAPDPYQPRTTAPAETTPEETVVTVETGTEGAAYLSDGTSVTIDALGAGYTMTLERLTNHINPEDELGLDPADGFSPQSSGSMRNLSIIFDASLTEEEKLEVVPTITIPRKEIGVLNPDTVNILRVSRRFVGGKWEKERSLLPAHFDSGGNLVTRDIMLPLEMLTEEVLPGDGGQGGVSPVYISYVPLTFQETVNWVRPSRMERMIPDGSVSARRRVFSLNLDEEEREIESKKAVKNVIVLVHGHNENEKTGLAGQFRPNAPAPWFVDYKRDVWTPLYEVFLKEYAEYNSCTAFYEFIYPTWRPIFNHLDDMLVGAIKSELSEQLALNKANKDSMPFNLFIIAHSMGGVVARAAAIKFPEELDERFEQLVTWGSPHRGAAMYTLFYQITSPAYSAKTWRGSILSSLISSNVSKGIISSPAKMDLRWTNGPPETRRYLRLDDYFYIKDSYKAEDDKYNLRTGTLLYNERINQLNIYDHKAARYTFLYGVTSKGLLLETVENAGIADIVSLHRTGDYIAIGATMNRFLVENGFNSSFGRIQADSDGAPTIVSMAGLGIPARMRVDIGNVDHEEYFHHPVFAHSTARRTFEHLGFKKNPLYDPPEIIFTSPEQDGFLTDVMADGKATLQGNIDWKGARDFKTGVTDIKVWLFTRATGVEGIPAEVSEGGWNIESNGAFSVACAVPMPEEVFGAMVVFVFGDGTELPGLLMFGSGEFETEYAGETLTWEIEGHNRIFLDRFIPWLGGRLFYYSYWKTEEPPFITITAQATPVFWEEEYHYSTYVGVNRGGGFVADDHDEERWERDHADPGHREFSSSVSINLEYGDWISLGYIAVNMYDHHFQSYIWIVVDPFDMEELDLFPPYFRPNPVEEE